METILPFARLVVGLSIIYCIIGLKLKKNIKISNDVNAISLVILLGALFDFFSVSIQNKNFDPFLLLTYYIFYPLYFIFCMVIPIKIKTHIFVQLSIFLCLIFLSIFVDFSKIRLFVTDNLVIPIFTLNTIAVILAGYRLLKNSKSKLMINIIFYLLLGLLAIQSISELAIYNYIQLDRKLWANFMICFSLYIILMRITFIVYVSKRIKS